jgi:magnesium chelatase family protein
MCLTVAKLPAEFILVAEMNPSPCRYRSHPRRLCRCTPLQVEKDLHKFSGPLLDRIDLHLEVPEVPFTQPSETPPARPRSPQGNGQTTPR